MSLFREYDKVYEEAETRSRKDVLQEYEEIREELKDDYFLKPSEIAEYERRLSELLKIIRIQRADKNNEKYIRNHRYGKRRFF